MASVRCPHCQNRFEWTAEMGEGRINCPLCGKALEVARRKKKPDSPTEATAKESTGWGTEGLQNTQKRLEYGEIRKGDVLGGFRIEEMLGAGAMAVVYRATQLSLDRPVALKILPKDFAHKPSFVRQFDSETELLASLNHPNIVSIIDRGHVGDTYFFAMELVEGTTLSELLASGEMDEEFFLRVMEQCAEALAYAHSKGIIHRDIKPANIMLNDQGQVKIADFGVAGLVAEAGAATGGKKRVMGTRGYMAPEQEIHINRTDARSDIFALGAVMYRALTNTIPDHLPPVPPSRLNPHVDPRIDALVLKCLEASPDRRYQSAKELLEALRAYHRQIARIQEVCPRCKKENPVTQRVCLHCGADLSELFDKCPECGSENRIDVEICMSCGRSLAQLRQQISVKISKLEEKARELASKALFDEALAQVRQVLDVQGKLFQRARERAERLIASYTQQRKEYYLQRIEEAKQNAAEGKLSVAQRILETIPADFHQEHDIPGLLINIKSRMALAKKRVEDVGRLLEQKRFDEVQSILSSVERMWADCPGLQEARQQLKAGRETQAMVDYSLEQSRQHLSNGDVVQARQAIEFALSTVPDDPRVKSLLSAIEEQERQRTIKTALEEGQKAFAAGDFRHAIQHWTAAMDLLGQDNAARQRLAERITEARARWVKAANVVRLEGLPVVKLEPASEGLRAFLASGALVPACLAAAAVSIAVILIALAR